MYNIWILSTWVRENREPKIQFEYLMKSIFSPCAQRNIFSKQLKDILRILINWNLHVVVRLIGVKFKI